MLEWYGTCSSIGRDAEKKTVPRPADPVKAPRATAAAEPPDSAFPAPAVGVPPIAGTVLVHPRRGVPHRMPNEAPRSRDAAPS